VQHLARRLGPLTVLIGFLISLVAPTTYYLVERSSRETVATGYAGELSENLHDLVLEGHTLWKYQAQKYFQVLDAFLINKEITAIHILDEAGKRIPQLEYSTRSTGRWWDMQAHGKPVPIMFNNRQVGQVQIDVSLEQLVVGTFVFLSVSVLTGLCLAFLAYYFPVKIVSGLEVKIDGLLDSLQRARDELEMRVEERTEQLVSTNYALQAEVVERKRIEEALRRSEENYRELVQNASSIILRMDSEGNIVFFNEFAQRFFGYTEEEIIGRKIVGAIIHETETSKQWMSRMIADILKKPDLYIVSENENICRSGKRVWIYWTNKALLDDEGRVCGVLCVGSDISERKSAEDALRLDEARLEALLELSQRAKSSSREIAEFVLEQGIRLTKSQVGFLGFLDESEEIFTFQASSRTLAGQCTVSSKLIHLPVAEAGLWAEAIRERKPVIINDYKSSDPPGRGYPQGHIPVDRLMGVPVIEGPHIVAVMVVANKEDDYDQSDVRQLRLHMDGMWKVVQRQRTEQSLRQAESLAAMGRALSSVAHDMRTPLVAIGGFTRIAHRHMEDDHPDREKLEIVIKETGRLENMVKDMLDFSKPLELDRSAEDVNQVIQESIAVVERAAQDMGVSLQIELARDLPSFSLDVMRMKQVIINLVLNAVQASSQGEFVRVATHRSGNRLIIDVRDHGCGIPVEKRDEIFLPFISTKKEGTGLGLPIVKKIVEAHQGHVEILDETEKGVTFRVVIPQEKEA